MKDKYSPIHGGPRGRIPGTNQTQNAAQAECSMVWVVNHTGHPGICLLRADVDECTQSPGLCGRGVCENLPGSFRCVCPAGFRGSACEEDVDECAQQPPPCGPGRCDNTAGSFHCACPAGFHSRGPGAPCQGEGVGPKPAALWLVGEMERNITWE